ncbi:MAG: 2-hydroxyacyl-CoA dehydratase family protein [Pseudomonadota bacterium]
MNAASVVLFRKAWEETRAGLRRPAGEREKYIGYFCTYTPREIIHAAGFIPVRVEGGTSFPQEADALTPGFICPFLRTALDAGLRGEYRGLRGLVQGYTCDAACGVLNIWRENIGAEVFHSLPLPYNDNADSRLFLRRALEELIGKLKTAGGRYTDESLENSLALYGRIRELSLSLAGRRDMFSASDFNEIIRAGFVVPPEKYVVLLEKLATATDGDKPAAREGTPILVSGGLIEDPRVWELVEACGAVVAADDLCGGMRSFHPPFGAGDDPLGRLMDRHFKRRPCPVRARALERVEDLIASARESGARGVVVFAQKFCTPQLADFPIIREKLNAAGLPALLLEMEETEPAGEGMRGRLRTFLEIIGG